MKPFILGAIFARGGSKGIPKKNIRRLAGKPLLAYAIETGRKVRQLDALIVSTDSAQIARVACRYGAQVPFMRPAALAADDTPEILAWKHAVKEYTKLTGRKVDILVSLPATSPLRAPQDVSRCIEQLLRTKADVVITVRQAQRNPYFNMVKLDKKGNASRVVSSRRAIGQRQRAPKVFDMTTVAYAVRTKFLVKAKSLFDGRVSAVIIPDERAWDIDTPLDWDIAEFLMKKK